MMRRYFGCLLIIIFAISCNDGNIDVTTFNYDETTALSKCGSKELVLYNINNGDVNEAISLKIGTNPFPTSTGTESVTLTAPIAPITFSLTETGTNVLVYRTFDGTVPSDYFCNSIPPSNPRVVTEYRAVGGKVTIQTSVKTSDDNDGDGIKNVDEGMASNPSQDTDGDGIPDYMDIDDDGDNVPTKVERVVSDNPTQNGYGDTDKDGIPNYLDDDDDGDGIPTKLEVTQDEQDPQKNTNAAGKVNYLNEFISDEFTGVLTFKLKNVFNQSYTSLVVIEDLKFKKITGDGGEISYSSLTLGTFSNSYTFEILPEAPATPATDGN